MGDSAQTVVVTGASSGIGRGTAAVFSDAGWRVLAIDRQEALDDGQDVKIHRFYKCELSDTTDIERVVKEISKEFSELNALVNNAGINTPVAPIDDWTLDQWKLIAAINQTAPWLLSKLLKPLLLKAHGSIVFISSVHAIATDPGVCGYTASKGAISALTRQLAMELGPQGIRVNAVLPGAVDTPLHRRHIDASPSQKGYTMTDDKVAEFSAKSVVGRVGQPREIGKACLFLSDNKRAGFITGVNLVVDGGLIVKCPV